jgi:hypothetical protein
MRYLMIGLLVFGLVACGDDDEDSPAKRADAYARELSSDETGCSTAEPGPEAEAHPGCIYSAAFAGCLEGITGEQVTPLSAEEEWKFEPGLVEIHRMAVKSCSDD